MSGYGYIFNIHSSYPSDIMIDGIEFQIQETSAMSYEMYAIATSFARLLICVLTRIFITNTRVLIFVFRGQCYYVGWSGWVIIFCGQRCMWYWILIDE